MSLDFAIKVVNENGDGVPYTKILIDFGFVGPGFAYEQEYTDEDGWAMFVLGTSDNSLTANTISINGDEVDTNITLYDGDRLSYTV